MYYVIFLGTMICRLRGVCLDRGCGGGGLGTLPSTSPNARRRFVDFGAADCGAVRIALLACSANFLVVAASFLVVFAPGFCRVPEPSPYAPLSSP
jgi:hypothetical protein